MPTAEPDGRASAAVFTMVDHLLATLAAAADLRFCLSRDPGADGEVDVLVHPADLDRALAVLDAAAYHRVPSWGRGSHRFLRRYDPALDAWLLVDVVTSLDFGAFQEFGTETGPALLDRARGIAGHRLHPADEFWALFGHVFVDRGGRQGRHAATLRRLATQVPPADLLSGPMVAGPGAPFEPLGVQRLAALPGAVTAADATTAEQAGRDLRAAWSGPGVTRRRLRHRTLLKLSRVIVTVRRPGMTVVLAGPDRSTAVAAADAVAAGWPLAVVRLDDVGSAAGRARAMLHERRGRLVLATSPPSATAPGRTLTVDPDADPDAERRRLVEATWALLGDRWRGRGGRPAGGG